MQAMMAASLHDFWYSFFLLNHDDEYVHRVWHFGIYIVGHWKV
jgi:hypothetical protein